MTDSQRFLRNPLHRAALYMAQDGMCARCGGPLGDDWEADHRVPWAFVQRTNLAEMQALCKSCHKRKGMTVDLQDFAYRRSVLRDGQRETIDAILTHRRAGQQLTSAQLVARYGKSDTIRLSALEQIAQGLITHALVITPFDFLMEQMLAEPILRASANRYGFHRAMYGQVQTIDGQTPIRPARFTGKTLSSITTYKAARPENLAMLTGMAERSLRGPQGPGLPWAIYLDEAHMASEGKAWGEIVPAFLQVGAYVTVLTGTPYRNDGAPIPGFKRRWVSLGWVGQREKGEWLHEADVTVTYADALQETPPPVAYITYQPFGIAGELRNPETGEIWKATLNDLTEEQLRAAYISALSDPAIIEVPLSFMVAELLNRRNDPSQEGTLGLVFIGSDAEGVSDDEEKQGDVVEGILRRLAPTLTIEQIHQKRRDRKDPITLLQDFVSGDIDIAIVKQMGAVGMDAPALKVIADLGNTRSPAAQEQRMMRCTTLWGTGGRTIDQAVYIAPDDWLTRRLVENILAGTGTIKPVLIGPTPPPGPPGPLRPPQPEFHADEIVLDADMKDATGETVSMTYIDPIDDFRAEFGDSTRIGKARLGRWIARTLDRLTPGETPPEPPPPTPPEREPSEAEAKDDDGEWGNITRQLMQRRTLLETLVKNKVNILFQQRCGRPYRSRNEGDSAKFGALKAEFQANIYRKIGLRKGTSAPEIDDVFTLDRIIQAVKDA